MQTKLKIVGIGNSIVNGFPLKRSECFLSQIRLATGHQVINKGVNGETTEDIVKRFTNDLLFHCPDMGIVMTGTNDFIYKKATPEQAMEKLDWMVGKMVENQIEPVLLIPMQVNVTMAKACWMADAHINYEEVNEQIEELGYLMSKKYPQFTIGLQKMLEEEKKELDCQETTVDGIHPTALTHEKIARIIIREKIN